MVSQKTRMALFSLVLLGTLQGCLSVQSFVEEPGYTEVNPSADTELRCLINEKGGDCLWQKDGKPIAIFPGKYEWAGKPSTGDCSLKIKSAEIKFDDGNWVCQVTGTSFQNQDNLASESARLVVREPPVSFSVMQNKNQIPQNGNITVVDGQLSEVQCETRKSNPAPEIQWLLGARLLKDSEQTNETENENDRRWKSVSVLKHSFSSDDFGNPLICRINHPAYPNGYQETSVNLDILYKPKVTVQRSASDVLEEGKGSISITCLSESNPPARVYWRKYDNSEENHHTQTLEFNPVTRANSGTYICQADNQIGKSNEEPVEINVEFPPKILRVTGGGQVGVHNRTILTCSAEGNPLPKYQWLQKLPSQQVLKRGYEDKLIIDDANYDHQGEYVCEAVNMIGGVKRSVQSDPIQVEVRGAPQVLRYSVAKEVEAISGRDVRLEMEVCSDPVPSKTTWEWGQYSVEAGKDLSSRFLAEQMVAHPERDDCYIARLVVKQVSPADSKRYYLNVENIHGNDKYAVSLTVKDPVSMASVIGVVIALLVLFLVLVVVLLYAYKKQKLCFKDESKLDKGLDSLDKHNGYDAEKNIRKNSHGLNGNGSRTLAPGSMYPPNDVTHAMEAGINDKLWPENPTYQVYIPGYNPTLLRTTTASIQQQQQQHRAGSISPNTLNTIMASGDNRILYAELQFPVTSNYGSMKKRSQRDSVANTTASTSVHSGEPSPTSNIMMMSLSEEQLESGSLESIHGHRYVPEYLAISNRKTAV